MPIIYVPFRRMVIDIVGSIVPLSSLGNRHILTVVDMATRYPDAVALRNIGTEQAVEAFVEEFSRYRELAEVLCHGGSNFTSDPMKEATRLQSI